MTTLLADKTITVLTGAGISAESGVPTFRGPEGYWTVGSRHFHPEQMATRAMFSREPEQVWRWYLHRARVCREANPNPGHLALVEMERSLSNQFTLITQNVDNLHLRAGSNPQTTLQIHGNIFFMRCTNECKGSLYPVPLHLLSRHKDQPLSADDYSLLSCQDCGVYARPHVLWFDECYDERHYRFETALAIADKTDVLIIAGTSGATTLPNLIANRVSRNKGIIIDINLTPSPFTELALGSINGRFINKTCTEGLTDVLNMIC